MFAWRQSFRSGSSGWPSLGSAGIIAISAGAGLGYAVGTGLDNATDDRWGHWWYNALGGVDAPDSLPADPNTPQPIRGPPMAMPPGTMTGFGPCIDYGPDGLSPDIDSNKGIKGGTNEDCLEEYLAMMKEIDRMKVSTQTKARLAKKAGEWQANCMANATDKK